MQLALDLVNDRPVNVADCIDSPDRFITAAMLSLKSGCSPKLTGTMLISVLCAASPSDQIRELQLLSKGGTLSFNGTAVTVSLRHCRLAVCNLANNTRYTGSWIAGRMTGYGCIENTVLLPMMPTMHHTCPLYVLTVLYSCAFCRRGVSLTGGGFQDNRPHGVGTMMDDKGKPHYVGGFSHGTLHGNGKKFIENGFVEGDFVAGSLTCTNGVMKHSDMQNMTTTEYTGGFLFDQKNGLGTQTTYKTCNPNSDKTSPLNTENRKWVSTYTGYFENNKKMGVGVLACKKSAYLGIWWNDVLWLSLQDLDPDTARSIPLQHIMRQAKPALGQHRKTPSNSHVHVCTQTNDTEIECSMRSTDTRRPVTDVHVFSLCALTGIPRKELTMTSNQCISTLSKQVRNTSTFFFRGSLLPIDNDSLTFTELYPSSETMSVYFVRCPVCVKSAHMKVTTGSAHIAFEMLECTDCVAKPTACLYCRICGLDPKHASTALYRLEKGVSHMTSVHGVKL